MTKRLILLVSVVLLLSGCVTSAFVRPIVNDDECAACGYTTYGVKFIPAYHLFLINGGLTSYDQPVLKVRCLRCGFETVHKTGGDPCR